MSERIRQKFAHLKEQGRAAFVAYMTAGDPDLDTTQALALGLEEMGVDILELGVPFSDPVADGQTNQAAAQRALESGTTLQGIFEMARNLRKSSQLPLVLFTYLNPVYTYGFARFHKDAAEAGIDGVLILDLPPDEACQHEEFAENKTLDRIRLVAPTTSPKRMAHVVSGASGFIYYVSREGVTGEQDVLAEGIASHVEELRKWTALPVVVGFGISTPEQSAAVAQIADGVVVGSAIVRRIAENGKDPHCVEKVLREIRPMVAAAKSVPKKI